MKDENVLGMGLDLTDRKKSEEAIKRQMNDSKEFHRQQMTPYI
jgi:hypothetical protein